MAEKLVVDFCMLVTLAFAASLTFSAGGPRGARRAARCVVAVIATLILVQFPADGWTGGSLHTVPVVLAGLLGGPFAALAVALPSAALLWWLQGPVALSAALAAVLAALACQAVRARFRRHPIGSAARLVWWPSLVFGVANLPFAVTAGEFTGLVRSGYLPLTGLCTLGFAVSLTMLDARYLTLRRQQTLRFLTGPDELTGVAGRRQFESDLRSSLAGAERYLLLLDADHFRRVNDAHGYHFGDRVLGALSRVVQESVRPQDRVYRYGGAKFAVLLDDCSREHALLLAERVRADVEGRVGYLVGRPASRFTVSVGVSQLSANPALAVQSADEMLHCAKASGRNRVAAPGSQEARSLQLN